MYFGTKSYLKNTRNHTAKHALKIPFEEEWWWHHHILLINLFIVSINGPHA